MGPIRALSWSARQASDSTTGKHTTRRRDSTDALSPTETPERNTGKKHRKETPHPQNQAIYTESEGPLCHLLGVSTGTPGRIWTSSEPRWRRVSTDAAAIAAYANGET